MRVRPQVAEREGRRAPEVETPDAVAGGYREVWSISTDLPRLTSVGILTEGSGKLDLPEGVDMAAFAVVDVSDESFDGDPAHSGNSIVRGQLG